MPPCWSRPRGSTSSPIRSGRSAPRHSRFVGPKRVRAPGVRFEDLPKIDLVLVSHNHYDHMDLPTLKRLWERDRPRIVTSLGNDTILKGEGIGAIGARLGRRLDRLRRSARPRDACAAKCDVRVERNHHWGSRWGTDRNRALWSAFTVRLPRRQHLLRRRYRLWRRQLGRRSGAPGADPPRHPAGRRLRAARRHAGQPHRSRRGGADVREAEGADGAGNALGHLPAHLRGHRRPAEAARGRDEGAGDRGRNGS